MSSDHRSEAILITHTSIDVPKSDEFDDVVQYLKSRVRRRT